PFHDFPEGPDWWDTPDYRAVIAQLPKLRMNFIGLHCYPERNWDPELTVWIGLEEDVRGDGDVEFSYPASYANTWRPEWGYQPKDTGDYLFGASLLFPSDGYGPDVMDGWLPTAESPGNSNEAFNGTGDMLSEAFDLADALGVTTCVGTETPLTIPAKVQERMRERGIDPASDEGIKAAYRGIFERAARAYAPDYYWLWTPEGWTWSGTTDEQVEATARDIELALEALEDVGDPMTLGTCGWVLGPPRERSLFDDMLPPDSPMACINQQVGVAPVEPAFADIDGRPQWAIPWLEDDPAMTAPQLWVSRMRRDAQDALEYGCTGLMGIHWRTRNVAPMVSALAKAGWRQDDWRPLQELDLRPAGHRAVGGTTVTYPQDIDGTDDDPLYRSVRYDLRGYVFQVENGEYDITLRFCEPHYDDPGRRVFGAALEGERVIDSLDILERVGKNHALDFTYEDVRIEDGWVDIEFIPIVELPAIAAIDVVGEDTEIHINCAGPAYEEYQVDLPVMPPPPSGPPSGDFYLDWARALFGPRAARPIAEVFESVDGRLPRPATWVGGPGGLLPDPRPMEEVEGEYAFVDELAALRPLVTEAGALDRFDYWLGTFRYMESMAHVRVHWAQLQAALAASDVDTAEAAYRQLVASLEDVYQHLLPVVTTPGERGTVMNWEGHILPSVLAEPTAQLEALRGEPLPGDWRPRGDYRGPLSLRSPVRTSLVRSGESIPVEALVLSESGAASVRAVYRRIGSRSWQGVRLTNTGRGCWQGEIPAADATIEYYLECVTRAGERAIWPASAPSVCETVVVWE
ncbi:MAG: hypothetical protein GF320_16135, partial [Armatimonadia bacterium]|nr:hypothetical protein [Armatimonadia bacterium]